MFSFCVITCACFVPTKNLQVDCFFCQKIGGTTGDKRGNAVILVLLLEISKINPCSERVLIWYLTFRLKAKFIQLRCNHSPGPSFQCPILNNLFCFHAHTHTHLQSPKTHIASFIHFFLPFGCQLANQVVSIIDIMSLSFTGKQNLSTKPGWLTSLKCQRLFPCSQPMVGFLCLKMKVDWVERTSIWDSL